MQDNDGCTRVIVNCVLAVASFSLIVFGAYAIWKPSTREVLVNEYNEHVAVWNSTERDVFSQSQFTVLLRNADGIETDNRLSQTEDNTWDHFGNQEAGSDLSAYQPLLYVSPQLQAAQLMGNSIESPISAVLSCTNEFGTSQLTLPKTRLYKTDLTHGNQKVCRNSKGTWKNGHCYFSWSLRSICVVVTHTSHGYMLDPARAHHGCNMPGWDPFVYVKDLQHTAGQGNFMLRIFVRDSADPLLFARNATRKEQPAFGDSHEDMHTEGAISLAFGAFLGIGPAIQALYLYRDAREAKRERGFSAFDGDAFVRRPTGGGRDEGRTMGNPVPLPSRMP